MNNFIRAYRMKVDGRTHLGRARPVSDLYRKLRPGQLRTIKKEAKKQLRLVRVCYAIDQYREKNNEQ